MKFKYDLAVRKVGGVFSYMLRDTTNNCFYKVGSGLYDCDDGGVTRITESEFVDPPSTNISYLLRPVDESMPNIILICEMIEEIFDSAGEPVNPGPEDPLYDVGSMTLAESLQRPFVNKAIEQLMRKALLSEPHQSLKRHLYTVFFKGTDIYINDNLLGQGYQLEGNGSDVKLVPVKPTILLALTISPVEEITVRIGKDHRTIGHFCKVLSMGFDNIPGIDRDDINQSRLTTLRACLQDTNIRQRATHRDNVAASVEGFLFNKLK